MIQLKNYKPRFGMTKKLLIFKITMVLWIIYKLLI